MRAWAMRRAESRSDWMLMSIEDSQLTGLANWGWRQMVVSWKGWRAMAKLPVTMVEGGIAWERAPPSPH